MKTKRLAVAIILSGVMALLMGMGGSNAGSKWIGSYRSVSGKCGGLVIQESSISWGLCKEAATKLISVSDSQLVMAVDPSAGQCEWAGFIVALRNEDGGKKPRNAAPRINISAYQGPDDYKADNRFVQCSFTKKEQ
jgi:hypothetical protein